jgi:hypothetical protein
MKKFISGPNIATMRPVHDDDRRSIREAEMILDDGSVRRVTELTISGISRAALGNHYHPIPEYFTVHEGSPTLLTANVVNPAEVTSEILDKESYVTIPPKVAHTFIFDGPGRLVSTMDAPFRAEDMIPHPLDPPHVQK